MIFRITETVDGNRNCGFSDSKKDAMKMCNENPKAKAVYQVIGTGSFVIYIK